MIRTPSLDHDKMMAEKFDCHVSASGKTERRIVANLCAHLKEAGFSIHSVFDGEEETRVADTKAAMELIFNLDEASLRFYKDSPENWHGVLLVMGEGSDIVTDWNFYADDRDGFNAAMDAFDPYSFE